MQYIPIFLASSIDEFAAQRESLGDFVRCLNDHIVQRGVYLELSLCEDMSKAIRRGRKQEEYNQKIRQSQYFYLLFGQRVGPSALEEFDVALQQSRTAGLPELRLFSLPAPQSAAPEESALLFLHRLETEPGCTCRRVTHLDAVKLDLLLELNRLPALQGCLTFREEAVLLCGEPVLSTGAIRDLIPRPLPDALPEPAGVPAPDLRYVRMFLEAGAEEFAPARQALGDFIRTLNDLYVRQGLYFQLTVCRDPAQAVRQACGQEISDTPIRQSHYFYLLFGQHVGPDTVEDFNTALAQFQATQAPQIEVFFHRPADGQTPQQTALAFIQRLDQELGHYFCQFTHLDSVKLELLMELARDPAVHGTIAFRDGKALLNEEPFLSLENIPLYSKNEAVQRLVRELAQLDLAFDTLTEQMHQDPDREDLKLQRLHISRQYRECSEQLKALETDLLDLYKQVQDRRSQPGISAWEREALARIDLGDYEGAKAILRDKKREEELHTAQQMVDRGLDGIRQYISGKRTLIRTLQVSSPDQNGRQEIRQIYEKLVALAEQYHIELDVLYDYASFLDDQHQYSAGIAVAERLRGYYEADPDTPQADQARLLNLLGNLYSNNHHFDKAGIVYQEALAIRRDLAKENPDAYSAALADSCNNLAILLDSLNQKSEAEPLHREALTIYRCLTKKNPDAYSADLAISCNNLASLLDDLNQKEEAEQLYREALTIYHRLAKENPDAYSSNLASSLNNLAILLHKLRQSQEAELLHREALTIYRRLAKENPDAYSADLALSCNNLANLLNNLDQFQEAELLHREALTIRRRLAEENPEAYSADLALSCNNLAILLKSLGQTREAEQLFREALAIRRHLAEENPDVYSAGLADSCNSQAILLDSLDHFQEAEQLFREALDIRQRLANQNPDTFTPALASSFNNLAILLRKLGQLQEAEQLYREALTIWRRLANQNPDVYNPTLATACWNLGVLLDSSDQSQEAEQLYREALDIRRCMVQKDPDAFAPTLASSCNDLAVLLKSLGRAQEAEQLFREALALRQRMAQKNPDAFIPTLASSFYNLAVLLHELGQAPEAEQLYREALAIWQHLAQNDFDAFSPVLATCCDNLSIVLDSLGRSQETEPLYREAIAIYRCLAKENPDTYSADLAGSCNDLAILLDSLGRFGEAEQLFREALAIWRHLAQKDFDAFAPALAGSCNNLAILLCKLGQPQEAELLRQEALAIIRRLLSRKNPNS